MLNRLKNYVIDRDFHFCFEDGRLNIINYEEIVVLEESRISLRYQKGLIVIKGKDLIVNKLMDQEILISGIISSIELG